MIVWRGVRPSIMPVIEFDKETIGNILISKKNLSVPINQRSYAWKREHVEDLYQDLNNAITDREEEYFLGAIIVVVPGSQLPIDVYDGQQRLATSMILIGAIRDYFFTHGDHTTADTIAKESLFSPERKTNEPRPHFRLSGDDNTYFTDSILRAPDDPKRLAARPDPKKDSHSLIDEAREIAAEHVATITDKLTPASVNKLLHRWLDFIADGTRVIWVEVEDQPTAYRIFETMNDRGLKLSAADLIKNYLYSLAGKRQADVVQKWQSMVSVLESLGKEDGDVVDYIRYFWVMTHGKTRSNELFDSLKKEVNSEVTVLRWVTSLEARTNDYAALLTPSHPTWLVYHPEIRALVGTLRFLSASQMRPLLLAALERFSKAEMQKLLKTSVNWSVRCLMSGVSSNTLEDNYSKCSKGISDGAIKSVADLYKELLTVIPADERFLSAATTVSVQTASLARYYLRRIQMEADNKLDKQYVPNDGEQVTLEHILPQRPGRGWTHVSADDAKANYNRLGNQALLSGKANSRLNNAEFKDKRKALSYSPFSLTKSVAKVRGDWGLKEITARQEVLARHAISAWPLNI
jgi:hypothetical protein